MVDFNAEKCGKVNVATLIFHVNEGTPYLFTPLSSLLQIKDN